MNFDYISCLEFTYLTINYFKKEKRNEDVLGDINV